LAAGIWPLAEIREAIILVIQKEYQIKHVADIIYFKRIKMKAKRRFK
jgi:hypothetical protein